MDFIRCRLMLGLLMLALTHAVASTGAKESEIRRLPTGPGLSGISQSEGKDFLLHRTEAVDADGHAISDIPAWLVDAADFGALKDQPAPSYGAKIPAFKGVIPRSLRNQVALYFFYEWVVVPRDWRVRMAVLSADTTAALSLAAPDGAEHGWLTLENIYACVGCMYSEGDGLIPAAHRGLIKDMFLDLPPGPPPLSPRPFEMHHSDPCTALFAYRLSGSPPVRAMTAMIVGVKGVDEFAGSIYVAMPEGSAALTRFIIHNYQMGIPGCDGKRG